MKQFKPDITPGPWKLIGDRLSGNRDIPTFAIINGLASSEKHIREHRENMAAIAAIPEMYDVCQAAIELRNTPYNEVDRRRLLIEALEQHTDILLEKHGVEKL